MPAYVVTLQFELFARCKEEANEKIANIYHNWDPCDDHLIIKEIEDANL